MQTAFITVSHALFLLLLCRSEPDLCPMPSQAQTTDMKNLLAKLYFKYAVMTEPCSRKKGAENVRFYLPPFLL